MTINNRFIQTLKCCLALLLVSLFVAPTALSADSSVEKTDLLTFSNQNLRGKDKNYQPVNSWTPYFTWIGNVQDQTKNTITQSTIGVGFLYGSGWKGNLLTAPQVGTTDLDATTVLANGIGSVSYNRTPVYEWTYGYKAYTWLSVLFSIQNQNSVNVQTNYVSGRNNSLTPSGFTLNGDAYYQFRSQLGLNSLMLKVNFELPWVLVWKNWMYASYLGAGVGPGWQSWTDNRVYVQTRGTGDGTDRVTFVNTLSQKISANCVFMIDSGFRMKPAVVCANISILWGCKFNYWGQTRSIGKFTQQGSWNQGLRQPIRAKSLYSFVPYVGFQWNF